MRVFVALDLPEGQRAALARLQGGLSFGRAVDADALHLTLAFLGEVDAPHVWEIAEALVTLRAPAVPLSLAGLEVFERALAVGASGAGLEALQQKVARRLREAGADLPRRRFRPHVTIARLPRQPDATTARRLAEFLALNGTFSAPEEAALGLTLYRSHLGPEGADYEALAEVALVKETP